MGMQRKQGENVKIVYSGAPGAEAVAVLLYDANDVVRTLQPWERLLVDEVQFNTTATADTSHLAYLIEASAAPTAPPTAGLGVLASFSIGVNLGSQGQIFPAEGAPCAVGNTLFLLDDGNGWNGAFVNLAGVGRVVEGKTQGVHPRWRELLTSGGNPNGQ